jgi:heme A synthase
VLGAVVALDGFGAGLPRLAAVPRPADPAAADAGAAEWFHRLAAFLVSMLTLVLAVSILARAELRRVLLVRLVLALGLLVMQIVLGR